MDEMEAHKYVHELRWWIKERGAKLEVEIPVYMSKGEYFLQITATARDYEWNNPEKNVLGKDFRQLRVRIPD